MIELGILAKDEQVGLLKGRIFTMPPIDSHHTACVNRLILLFSPLLASRQVVVSVRNPIHVDDHAKPQPGLLLARSRPDAYKDKLPESPDILLLVEIAASLDLFEFYSTVKLPVYAGAGVLETLSIHLDRETVAAFHIPGSESYEYQHTYSGEERLSLAALPDFSIA